MRKEEIERRLHELRKKYISLVSSMQMAKAQKVKNKIEALERELEPHSLGEMLQDYTPEFKVEMLKKMHRLFVYSDLLEGAVLISSGFLMKRRTLRCRRTSETCAMRLIL